METVNLSALRNIYQDSKEQVLFLAVVSPTWMPCLQGAQLVQEIFETNKSEKLRGVIVWIPMLETDNFEAASLRETKFSDPRVKQFWDQNRVFARLLSQTLDLNEPIAWDVYLVYPSAHSWNGELPPMPMFWMHQLNEEPGLFLDPPRLKEYVHTLLERAAFQ